MSALGVLRRWPVAAGLSVLVLLAVLEPVHGAFGSGGAALVEHERTIVYSATTMFFLALTFVGTTTLVWMLHVWRAPKALDAARSAPDTLREPAHSFSLIVPARHEELVLARTLGYLAELDHPEFEVLVVVGHDDDETRQVADGVAAADGRFRVVVDENWPKNKPKALNAALPQCRGEIVGVFDAEDVVASGVLRRVDDLFQDTGFEVVQGATQLMNHHSSWYSARNVLEYYFWFKSRLHFHAEKRFIPLGGNTVFIRASWLRALGGWDPECLAEDCELGARLSSFGARTTVFYDASLATREETPNSIRALTKQRTRWNQGYLQVLRNGDWRRLPPSARALAAYTLAFPFIQAVTGLMVPFAVAAAVLLELDLWLAMLSFLPAVPLLAVLAVELAGLAEFGREYGVRVRLRSYAGVLVGAFPYQLILAFAALRAVARELRGESNWEKTAHVGAHL